MKPKKAPRKPTTKEITALIEQNKWWPFDRVDGKLLVKIHKKLSRPPATEEALF